MAKIQKTKVQKALASLGVRMKVVNGTLCVNKSDLKGVQAAKDEGLEKLMALKLSGQEKDAYQEKRYGGVKCVVFPLGPDGRHSLVVCDPRDEKRRGISFNYVQDRLGNGVHHGVGDIAGWETIEKSSWGKIADWIQKNEKKILRPDKQYNGPLRSSKSEEELDNEYAIYLEIEGASGEYYDDMTLRDDIWSEIENATGLVLYKDHEGEVYETGATTDDPAVLDKLKTLKQKVSKKSTNEYYLDHSVVSIDVGEKETSITVKIK